MRYRVWDIEKGEYAFSWKILVDGDGAVLEDKTVVGEGDYFKYKEIRSDFVEVQRSSGMKDVNGQEIYEGDILRWCLAQPFAEKAAQAKPVVVEFRHGGFGFNTILKWLFLYPQTVEVMGNILPDPELMEQRFDV